MRSSTNNSPLSDLYRFLPGVDTVVKMVKALYLTSVVPSVTRLVSMEAEGAPFTPPSLRQCSVLRVFKAIAQRILKKVE